MTELDKFHRTLEAGECLFHEGEPGNCAYVLESGRMEVSTGRGEARVVLATVGPGALLGEMALINNQPRMATLTATEPTRLVMITRDYLSERLETADPMLRHILRVVLTRFREVVNQVHGGRREGEYEARMLADREEDQRDGQMAMKRLRIEQQLEMALDNRELELFYQPILRVADRSVSGFEALIRWRKPDGEMVPPAKFIPIAEQSNLMRRIGYWITDTAIAALARLQATSQQTQPGQPPLTMSINLSVRQFGDPDLFPCLQNSLADHQVDPRQVRLEITESMLFDSWELALGLLNQAKELGCRLAIDDFGTGYSSLSYLHRFPVDTLKIDQCFVREMFANQASRTIVRTMGVLARDLGMDCIAEGIEEQAQGDALRKMGIEYVQGFFYGKPMPEAEVVKYLHAQGIAA